MKRVFLIFLILMVITSCAPAEKPIDIPQETTASEAVEIAMQEFDQKTLDTITNLKNPKCEKIILEQNPSIICAKDEDSLIGKEVYKVTFYTKYDSVLGPIIKYIDAKNGELLGAEVRE